ncbi:MAG: hypothetical protein ACI971_000867, partial [Colwellia sp.]
RLGQLVVLVVRKVVLRAFYCRSRTIFEELAPIGGTAV